MQSPPGGVVNVLLRWVVGAPGAASRPLVAFERRLDGRDWMEGNLGACRSRQIATLRLLRVAGAPNDARARGFDGVCPADFCNCRSRCFQEGLDAANHSLNAPDATRNPLRVKRSDDVRRILRPGPSRSSGPTWHPSEPQRTAMSLQVNLRMVHGATAVSNLQMKLGRRADSTKDSPTTTTTKSNSSSRQGTADYPSAMTGQTTARTRGRSVIPAKSRAQSCGPVLPRAQRRNPSSLGSPVE